MKKIYAKPVIEIETYALSASIAANCSNVISMGPTVPDRPVCKDFEDNFEIVSVIPGVGIMSESEHKPFYNDGSMNCDCYYSSGNLGYFTS